MNHYWLTVNLTLRNKLHWNMNQNTIFIPENLFEIFSAECWPFCSDLNVLNVCLVLVEAFICRWPNAKRDVTSVLTPWSYVSFCIKPSKDTYLWEEYDSQNINFFSFFTCLKTVLKTGIQYIYQYVYHLRNLDPIYRTCSISWLLMTWWYKEIGHQQAWYWSCLH